MARVLSNSTKEVILELEKNGYSSLAAEMRVAFFPQIIQVFSPFLKSMIAAKIMGTIATRFGKFDLFAQHDGWYVLGRGKQTGEKDGQPIYDIKNELLRTKSKHLVKVVIDILVYLKDILIFMGLIILISKIFALFWRSYDAWRLKRFNKKLKKLREERESSHV